MNFSEDEDYISIIHDILENKEFNSIGNIEHHGTNRLEHSKRVSFYSYKIAKILKLDYEQTARAGLLHDFFISEENRKFKDRLLSTFIHPKESVKNSARVFGLTSKEENIIRSHMFPIYISIPKYAESWIVSIVDKIIGTYEFSIKFRTKLSYASNLLFLLFFSSL